MKLTLSRRDRKSTRLNSSHQIISYAVFCLKKKRASSVNPQEEERPPVSDATTVTGVIVIAVNEACQRFPARERGFGALLPIENETPATPTLSEAVTFKTIKP